GSRGSGGSSRGASSPRGASRRGGFGDDQGTRVGSPDSGGRGKSGSRSDYRGPSTQPVKEGLEGSILEGASGYGDAEGGRSTGAGAEASEGIHGASSRRGESSRTSSTNARSGSRETSSPTRSTKERSASEPMRGSERQHVSGYGGSGGAPKTSSDQREPARKTEQPVGGSRKRGSRAQGRLGDEEAGDGM
ncbi:MAG TPA: hypothetical protein VJ650_16260, partial [Gemmatimonadaceae bacterium]|nr:hypothetical protein [Gemmatimonadaceae bacterium]